MLHFRCDWLFKSVERGHFNSLFFHNAHFMSTYLTIFFSQFSQFKESIFDLGLWMIIFLAWNSKIVPRPSYVTWCILTCNVPSRVPCANSVTEVKSVTWLSLFMLTTKEGPKSLFTLISFSFVTIIRLKPVKCSFFKGRNPRKVFVRINQTINPLSFPKHNDHPYRPACFAHSGTILHFIPPR